MMNLTPNLCPMNKPKDWVAYEIGRRHDSMTMGSKPAHIFYFDRAQARQMVGDAPGALADYNACLEHKDDFAPAYSNRGALYFAHDELEAALQDFDQAIALQPDLAAPYVGRGNVWRRLGDTGRALADYNAALARQNDLVEAYYQRGTLRREQNALPQAQDDFEQVWRRNPDYVPAYLARGYVAYQLGDLAAALADYETYLALGGGERYGHAEAIQSRIDRLRAQLGQ